MKKLIIIPAYNESASIEGTVRAIEKNAPDFDYVVINDCSTDNTLEICRREGFNVVSLSHNLESAARFRRDICMDIERI